MNASLAESPASIQAVTGFDEHFFQTYPHSNGFLPGGELVLGRVVGDRIELTAYEVEKGTRRTVCTLPAPLGIVAPPYPKAGGPPIQEPWTVFWDIALRAPVMAVGSREGAWIVDLTGRSEPRVIYRPPAGSRIDPLVSLRSDGRRLLFYQVTESKEKYSIIEVDVETGRATVVLEETWWVNHAHYCPFDESWIGFCHEGACETIPDRLWAWHAEQAPKGRLLFDQRWGKPEAELSLGHERWCFHDRSALVVAYGISPGRVRGIYEVFPDGRPSRLVSEGDRDWHVAPSQDGRWAAVDTTGPHDAPGKGWENNDANASSDILILDMRTGRRRFLARSRQMRHPSHPHPVFDPAGRWIYYNELDVTRTLNRVMRVENPWAA